MANAINDGLNLPDQISTGGVDSVEIGSGAVLSANISGQQVLATHHKLIGTGSPTTYGQVIQTGTFVLGTGSKATVAFGTAFLGAPIVTCCGLGADALGWISVSGPTTTGFTALGAVASTSGTYIATGSGLF